MDVCYKQWKDTLDKLLQDYFENDTIGSDQIDGYWKSYYYDNLSPELAFKNWKILEENF